MSADFLVRLFPLPNLVLFPGAMQPLHIFEPRYRQMAADALDDDRVIGMVLLQPGWEKTYAGNPPIHPVACACKIVAEQRLDDGQFNILLRGADRVRIIEEVAQPKLYRVARVDLMGESPPGSYTEESMWRGRLRDMAPVWFKERTQLLERFLELIDSEIGLGMVTDLIAFAMPLDTEFKQLLLEEGSVSRRVEQLVRHLSGSLRPFPPDFSAN